MSYLIIVRARRAAGEFLRYECIGSDQYRILADGSGGEYAVLDNPATARLTGYRCEGSTRRAERCNGGCPPFAAEEAPTSTFVRQQCYGDSLYAIRRHGDCAEFQAELIESCSPLCGCGGGGLTCADTGCCGIYPNCYDCGGSGGIKGRLPGSDLCFQQL